MEKVCAWEATEQTGTMNFEMLAGENTIKLALDYTAYTIPETLQMEMTVNAKSCSVDDKTFDLTKGMAAEQLEAAQSWMIKHLI